MYARRLCLVGCQSGDSPTMSTRSRCCMSYILHIQESAEWRVSHAVMYAWWPAIRELEEMIQMCDTCQLHNKSPHAAPLHPWEWAEKPWTGIHIDYAGPFLGKMFLVAVDTTSKWTETHIVNSITSTATVCKLTEIFAQHGLPEIFISDNAPNFTSEEFQTFMRKNGIVHITLCSIPSCLKCLAQWAVQTVKSGIT